MKNSFRIQLEKQALDMASYAINTTPMGTSGALTGLRLGALLSGGRDWAGGGFSLSCSVLLLGILDLVNCEIL